MIELIGFGIVFLILVLFVIGLCRAADRTEPVRDLDDWPPKGTTLEDLFEEE